METQIITEKRFEKLSDFNLVYLINFEKLKLDDLIKGPFLKRLELQTQIKTIFGKKVIDNPDIPEKVVESFRFGEEIISHEGLIYLKKVTPEGEIFIECYKDATELVNQIFTLPVLKYTLSTISELLGKSVMSKDLLSLPGFKVIQNETYGDISLGLEELTEKGNKVRTCKLSLTIVKDNMETSVDLGIINYSIYGRRL